MKTDRAKKQPVTGKAKAGGKVEPKGEGGKLTPKQELFCMEYLKDLNATQAALRAGYSENTSRQIGQQNLSKLDIQERLQVLMSERSKRTEITVDRVLKEYAKIAFGDIRQLFDDNGDLMKITDLPDDTAACISSVDVDIKEVGRIKIGEVKKVKLWSKLDALEGIGRHLGMFNDKIEHSGQVLIKKVGFNHKD